MEKKRLSTKILLEIYKKMLLIRYFEDKIFDAYSQGVMPGLAHLYTGQEAVAVGICQNLSKQDTITSTHRGHGHLLAKGGNPNLMMAELFGRKTGYNKGKGGSMHIVDMELGILGANGIVGGGLGIAVGSGLTAKLLHEKRISVAFFGDGALNEGVFYETANIASLWKLPVLFVMENNQYGEYTSSKKVTAGNILDRPESLGIPAISVDGNDAIEVYSISKRIIDEIRNGRGPRFIECKTYRLRGHHMGDQGNTYGYRDEKEIKEWRSKDPINKIEKVLKASYKGKEKNLTHIREEITQIIESAFEFGKDAPFPDKDEVLRDVYA